MEINSLQGAAAYNNASSATSPANDTDLQKQNIEASRADLDTQTTRAAQEAFQVNLTQEAQNLQAQASAEQETSPPVEPREQTPEQPPETQNNDTASANEASQIVNIVA